jgi:hypothetical protein
MSLITDLTDEDIRTEWRHQAEVAEGDDDATDTPVTPPTPTTTPADADDDASDSDADGTDA